ncbi:MAG: DUF423 domain-containing protein [Hahellaceae bacterium]|nr:DUF423 domain-containing protein [Hahellaceae bacterium]MCP5170438.1 DUF423 domain-containing protein [Hahellaceae bacterium]
MSLAVALGAYGAHGAHWMPDSQLSNLHTAVQYHLVHSLALMLLGGLAAWLPGRLLALATALLGSGTLLFCGSLYLYAFSGVKWLGMITPLGGLCFIVGWLVVGVAALRTHCKPAGTGG